ncbi:hypothetical protein PV327_006263 [Microctonus hyperodae]|uniref:Shugoshin C-terminal domain-containing protein n=1 Tax=Microctonus hyperodae TaxID=165561 RepID=A0AA39KI19_MICHY|nr:hypothetical protein PV327_006263 [Microctonus hyperodae]
MPSVSNRRRVKRPTVLAKKSQHKTKSYNKNSRNLWYEKFKATKANNNALARALSKEKQESQYLFSQNIELTSQLQDMGVLVNNRNETISGILKKSTEALKLLVQVTNCVTNTIVACQAVVGKPQSLNSRSSLSSNLTNSARRESTRYSTGKSPARGVVQPMVSGHTITKPVINLSRINMPRIRAEPNLSIIDESIDDGSTLERTLINHTPHRIPVNQLNRITNGSVHKLLPERIRLTSSRLSEENEQLSNNQTRQSSNRLSHSNRNSRRVSRKSDQQQSSLNESSLLNDDVQSTIKSPRVALQDVSRLLQNSHSINIRTLMASDETSNGQENENKRNTIAINDNIINNERENDKINEKDSSSASSESIMSSPTYNFDPRKKKLKEISNNKVDDPLEGPSWLYNSPSQIVHSPKPNELCNNLESTKSSNEKNFDNENISKSRWSERQSLKLNLTNKTNHDSPSSIIGWAKTYSDYTLKNIENGDDDDDDGDDDNDESHDKNTDNNENITENDEDDSDKCENLSNIIASFNLRKKRNEAFVNDRLRQSKENVIRQRGTSEINDDDFTMIFDNNMKHESHNMNFDINELNLPVLEQPLINPIEIEPEPEITTTIKIITQARHRMPSMACDNIDTSLMESNTTVLIPNIRDSSIQSDFDISNNEINNDDNDSTDTSIYNGINTRKRTRGIQNRIESSSDSEPSITPEKMSRVRRKNIRKKDPSAAKVVLEKLKDNDCTKSNNSKISINNSSFNSVQSDAHSDSEGSNASNIMLSGRPRRQKAPINLKEPKLRTKLRRL